METRKNTMKSRVLKEKVPKYRNKKTTLHGFQFDSQKEAGRFQELLWMQRAGLIRNIELQPRYDLVVNGRKCGFYKADFRYEEVATGNTITEDIKHEKTRTAVFALKKKLVKALYNIDIVEVY
jgi:Protein of unknown function (DUF1064)